MASLFNGLGVVVVGGQWGDEGKGRIVDALAKECDVTVRFQGGNNAGHSLYFGEKSVVLHLIPCGVVTGRRSLIGNGVVIDPEVLLHEMQTLNGLDVPCHPGVLGISRTAHVILPVHKMLDAEREENSGQKIGTTKRGIGPTYEAKVRRVGLRMGDLVNKKRCEDKISQLIDESPAAKSNKSELVEKSLSFGDTLSPFLTDVGEELEKSLSMKKRILFEGAQGALLDVDHGTYPYVTSSNCVAAQASIGAGIGPKHLTDIWMVTKAYSTRVGEGPFFSELDTVMTEKLRTLGNEYGATTGRPRRIGWLDLPALKYAARLNGATGIVLTKIDVLAELANFSVVTHYHADDGSSLTFGEAMEVWANGGQISTKEKIFAMDEAISRSMSSLKELPRTCRNLCDLIENELQIPIKMVSYGRQRGQEFFS